MVAEREYALGMRAATPQASIDHLTAAGTAYPYEFKFRTAMPMQLFMFAGKVQGIAPVAAVLLGRALAVDPGSADLASKLALAQMAIGECPAAAESVAKMMRLVPNSAQAKRIAVLPCSVP